MDNKVDVNDEKIQAELKAAGAPLEGEFIPAGAQPGADPPPPPPPPPPPRDWTMASRVFVVFIDKGVCPNWNLAPGEKEALAAATKEVLDAWFPNIKLPPKIESLLALGGVFFALALSRMNFETGEIPPMRAPEPELEPDKPAADANRVAA